MNRLYIFGLLTVVILSIISCVSKKNTIPNGSEPINDDIKTETGFNRVTLKSNQYIVKSIELGKDGYVAILQDFEGNKKQMIASIPNMEEAFVQVKKDEIISITGEYFEKMNLIKAEKIKVINTDKLQFKAQDILVGFKNNVNVQQTIKELERNKGAKFVKIIFDVGDTKIALFKVPAGKEQKFIDVFSKNKNVKYAEPNKIMKTMGI